MVSYRIEKFAITIEKEGARVYRKSGLPIRFGTYSEIKTDRYEFQFNLNGEIKFIRGLTADWPHPSEWLKRTDGNDWVLYSPIRTKDTKKYLGEYYFPCLPYPSNSIIDFNPYSDSRILDAFASWSQLYADLSGMIEGTLPENAKKFINLVFENNENTLHKMSERLRSILGGRVTVLPPDTRHVEYEVIPLIVADGCLYHCDFCSVKSRQGYHPRAKDKILSQIRELNGFFGHNLKNYKALFLGNHDALGAGEERILMAVSEAYKAFVGEKSHFKDPVLYFFGSVDSFLNTQKSLFEKLDGSPYYTYINIGFESFDAETLKKIKKPIDVGKIKDAFFKMLDINKQHNNIEVSGNFLLSDEFPVEHVNSIIDLLSDIPDDLCKKGSVYMSPLMNCKNRSDLLPSFLKIKNASKLPVFIYLIQRL
jgi:hypothetical protein